MADSTQYALLKPCRLCGQWRAITDYYLDRGNPRSECKSCVKAAVKRNTERNAERVAVYQAEYRERHREKARRTTAAYREANPGRVREAMERYRAVPEHKEIAKRRAREFARANPNLRNEYGRRRYAAKKSGVVGFVTPELLTAKLAYWGNRCWMCGSTDELQVDHVKPIAKGGAHMLANLRPACRPCNASKSDRWPVPPIIRLP